MTAASAATLIVIAKEPRAGRAKTRLTPPLSAGQAADVAAAALRDTLDVVAATPAAARLLAFDGDASAWTPEGWHVAVQPGGGLDARLVAAFDAARALRPGPAVLVGMDTPQLRPAHIAGFDPAAFDACLGLATDGGFWGVGFAEPSVARAALTAVPMSTPYTGEVTLARLRGLGLRVQLFDELTDVDTAASAAEVASLAPYTAFAAAWAQCIEPARG